MGGNPDENKVSLKSLTKNKKWVIIANVDI